MRHINWHIGCSGFHYKEWKEIFYPKGLPQRAWFDHYATQFTTLEINNSFYRFPEIKTFDGWYGRSPAHFTFSVKAPRHITHLKRFNNTDSLVNEFYAVAREGLKEKLGAILFQLPPSTVFAEEVLQNILSQLDPSFQNVIEFRHNSWWRKEVFLALQAANVSFCGVSYPGLIDDAVADRSLAYYRFHGVPRLFHSAYAESFIERIARQISSRPVNEAFVYFNNTASAAALHNARFLQMLVATEG